MTHHTQEQINDVCRCIVGVGSPLMAILVSRLAEIEQWLRILSLIGGLIVCVLTIISFLRKKE